MKFDIVCGPFRYGTFAVKFKSAKGSHYYHFATIEQVKKAIDKVSRNDEHKTDEDVHQHFLALSGNDYYSSMYESWLYSKGTHSSSSISGS